MSRASKSMFGCSVYLIIIGITFLFFPHVPFYYLGIDSPPDLMSRMCGMVFLIVSYLYLRTSFKGDEMKFFYKITAQERCSIPFFLTIFYLLDYGNWSLLFFASIDLGLGLWTFIALHLDEKEIPA